MRPVNLIPKDRRRGALAGRRGELFSYALIGGLALLLIAVFAVVATNNKISDRKVEIAGLQQQEIDATARADALESYSSFASLEQARTATVSSLAQSRFDWERVLHELSRVIPADISLTKLTGKVLPEVVLENETALASRDSIAGPALEIVGCAPGQEEVAVFVAALEDIDGVTRVGVQSSKKPVGSGAGIAAAGSGGGVSDECRTADQVTKFEIVAAFDAAPVPAAAAAGSAPAPPPPATPAPEAPTAQQASDKAQKAQNLIPGS